MNVATGKQNSFLQAMSGLVNVSARSSVTTQALQNFLPWVGAATTEAGKKVTTNTALKLSAVYCAVEVLSNALAILPVTVEQKTGNSRSTLIDHRLATLIGQYANSYLTSFQFRKIMMRALLLRGNAIALVIRNAQSGREERLQYVDPSEVSIRHVKATDEITYTYMGQVYTPSDVIHLRINSDNGILGRSVLTYAADNMGTSLSAMELGASTFNAKGMTQGVIEMDNAIKGQGDVTPGQVKTALATAWRQQMSVQDPYRVAILDEGMKYKGITISPKDTMFLETYQGGVQDIARWFGVPPHLLMDLTNANYSNIYQMDLSFLQRGVMPYVVQFETEYAFKLLSFREKQTGHHINFDENVFLRMDLKSKGEYIRAMVLSGVITQNEGRLEVGKNPKEGAEHDQLLQPVNVQNESQIKKALQDEQ